jgi:uncharacterized membrane protein YhhN
VNWQIILLLGLALLACLLWAERSRQPSRILIFKTPLSLLFVVTAVLQPHTLPPYFSAVLSGLVLGLAGDVLLGLKTQGTFKASLAAFLLGHLAYVAAFALYTRPGDWLLPGVLLLWALAIVVYRWLHPHLGGMRVPVIAYVVVITLMMWAAWAMFWAEEIAPLGARLALIGAACFYVSDLFVARDRFISQGFVNRLCGLPLYYSGQFLIAFSVGLAS